MRSYEKRIVEGTIQRIGSDYLNLKLDAELGAGRLPYENMVKPPLVGDLHSHFCVGQSLTVFLEKNDHDNQRWWRLNQTWVQDNPWDNLEIGETIYGVVTSYYEDVAAFVRLENKNNISGFIHISESVSEGSVIQEVFEVGDHINAVVKAIDYENLHVDLSIKPLLLRRREINQIGDVKKPFLNNKGAGNVQKLTLLGIHWLIVEDDTTLSSRLTSWAQEFDCEVTRVRNLQHLEQVLSKGNVTHASVDANLDKFKKDKESARYIECIKRVKGIELAILTGDTKATDLAKKYSITLIFKPVTESALLNWLRNKTDLTNDPLNNQFENWEDEAIHWQAEGLEFEVKEKATKELERYVLENNCLAGIITLKVREGVLQIRTHFGLKNGNFEKAQHHLTHCMVHNIIESGDSHLGDRSQFGHMNLIVPDDANYSFGFPVTVGGNHNRAVVFFKNGRFSAEDHKKLLTIAPFLESLGEKLALVQANEADRSFANLGRLSAAVMHELRNDIGLFKTPIRRLKEIINEPEFSKDNLAQHLNLLEERCRTFDQLLNSNLNLIRKSRNDQFSLKEVLSKLLDFFEYEYDEQKKARIKLISDFQDIRINFPVLAFEQSIINLLQNSLYQISEKTGLVIIKVQISPPDMSGHSIYIDITDNGSGIPASVKGNLFKPRETLKGSKGTGMGLYISKNLLQSHGGDLKLVDSVRYFGTTFRICLPRRFDGIR